MSLRAFAVVLGAMLLAPIPFAAAAPPTFDTTTETYLVGFEPGQRDVALQTIVKAGAGVTDTLPAVSTFVVTMSPTIASFLAKHPSISYVELDSPVTATGSQWDGTQWDGAQWNGAQWNGAQWDGAQWNGAQWNGAQWDGTVDPGLQNGWQWGLDATRAPGAWPTEDGGRTANLCVADSGIDSSHRDLAPYVRKQYNAIENSNKNLTDPAGHGTHVAGIASATHLDGWGIAGISNSSLMSSKVLDVNGTGSASSLSRGITWCADNGADVILMALSLQGGSTTVGRAIDYAAARDVVMVASAGNNGPCSNCVSYPARDPRVIGVAAIGRDGALAPFSSNGPEVAVRAPGVDILSTLPGNVFGYGSGTSQAAAFVAGTAALLLEAKPSLTAAEVRTAITTGSAGGKLDTQGALSKVVPLVVPTVTTSTTASTNTTTTSANSTTSGTTSGPTTTETSTTTDVTLNPTLTTTETSTNATVEPTLTDTGNTTGLLG